MKRLTWSVVVVAAGALLVAGFAATCPAGTYHEVYQAGASGWALIPGPNEDGHHAEMFSASAEGPNQYQFQSQAGSAPGTVTPYLPPSANDPLIKTIENRVQYYPWIIVSLNETVLTWDIFKPGTYMSKGPIITVKANCPVMAFVGSWGTGRLAWWLDGDPVLTVPDSKDESTHRITFAPYGGASHGDNTVAIEDKPRVHSLLKDDVSPGTDPDVIEQSWWAYIEDDSNVTPSGWAISDDELGVVPGPNSDDWFTPAELEDPGAVELIPDSVSLHAGIKAVTFEKIVVEECDSEGYYENTFTLFFAPADP
jgi:hypothetical protein